APAPDVAFPTSGPRLPASDALASTSAPVLPRRASSTAPSISSLLPWPLARASGQRSQLFGATTKQPLKLVLAIDFDVGHNHGQQLLMDIDSRYLYGISSSWRERRTCRKLP